MEKENSQSKCPAKGKDFFKGLGHLLDVKRKRKRKTENWPPGDVKPGQEEGYAAWLGNFADEATYEKEMTYCCRLDLPTRLDILCKHLEEKGLRVQDIPMRDKATWLVLATCNKSSEASKVLIKYADRDLLMSHSNTKHYSGITALHSAVVNKLTDIIKLILDSLEPEDQKALIHHHITGERFINRVGGSSLALNFSCWVCCIEIFDLLLNRGAELDKQDSKGFNVIHTLVEVSTERPEEARAMVQMVFESLTTRRWYCRREGIDEMYWTSQEDKDVKKLLLSMKNHDGYTPLTLAAKIGATEMLDYIINCEGVYRNTLWQFGLDYVAQYDVTEVNPLVQRNRHFEKPNVMNLLVYRDTNFKVLEAFSIPVIKQLISIRWKWYRFPYMFWATWHVLTMVLCFYVPLTYIKGKDAFWYPHANRTLPKNATLLPVSEGIIYLSHMSHSPLQVTVFLASLLIILSNLLACIFAEIYDSIMGGIGLILYATRKWHGQYYSAPFSTIVKWDLFRWVLGFFLLSEILTLKELFVNAKISYGLIATSLIFGWYFVLYFFQGFRAIGYCSLIMHRILFTDMFSFGFVILVLQLGFGSAMVYLVNGDDPGQSGEGHDTIWLSLYTMNKITSGHTGEPDVPEGERQIVLQITFFAFVTMTVVMLLNMLIAAMSNTYSQLAEYQEQLWIRSRAAAMLLIERQFFRCFSVFMNKKCLTYDEDTDRWYLKIKTQVPPS